MRSAKLILPLALGFCVVAIADTVQTETSLRGYYVIEEPLTIISPLLDTEADALEAARNVSLSRPNAQISYARITEVKAVSVPDSNPNPNPGPGPDPDWANNFDECRSHENGFLCDDQRATVGYVEYAANFNGFFTGWYYHPEGDCPNAIPIGYSISPSCSESPVAGPGPGTDPIPVDQPRPNVSTPTGGKNAVFDFLASRPEAVKASSWRNQSSIDSDARTKQRGSAFPRYNATEDMAVQTNPGKNIEPNNQLNPTFGPYSSGKTGVYWEYTQWSRPSGGNFRVHKMWTIRQSDTDRSIEIRHRYDRATGGNLAAIDLRMYPTEGAVPATGPDQPVVQKAQFQFPAGVRQHRYAEVDYQGKRFRLWCKSGNGAWVQTHDVPIASYGAHEMFRTSGNTSQSGSGPWRIGFANFVVLRNFDANNLVR